MVSILRITDTFHEVSRQWLAQHLSAGDTLAAPTLLGKRLLDTDVNASPLNSRHSLETLRLNEPVNGE
jgi:hypothetical protein